MHHAYLNSNPRGGKYLRNVTDCAIGARLYTPPGAEHYKLLCLDQLRGINIINCEQENKSETRMMKISNACNINTKTRANQI